MLTIIIGLIGALMSAMISGLLGCFPCLCFSSIPCGIFNAGLGGIISAVIGALGDMTMLSMFLPLCMQMFGGVMASIEMVMVELQETILAIPESIM